MAEWRGYFAIEDLNLNASQRQTLANAIRQHGDNQSPFPNRRNHWRISLDETKIIFEAAFNDEDLTVNSFKQKLANIFSVAVGAINNSNSNQTFRTLPTPVVTFSHNSTNYLRMALFGGLTATWEQSRQEALAYLATNKAEWETFEE